MMGEIDKAPQDETQLNDLLTSPNDDTIAAVQHMEGDLLIQGAGGKMGPTLAQLAWRSSQAAGLPWRVRCVSRFTSPDAARSLTDAGIEVIGADLLQPGALDGLPDSP